MANRSGVWRRRDLHAAPTTARTADHRNRHGDGGDEAEGAAGDQHGQLPWGAGSPIERPGDVQHGRGERERGDERHRDRQRARPPPATPCTTTTWASGARARARNGFTSQHLMQAAMHIAPAAAPRVAGPGRAGARRKPSAHQAPSATAGEHQQGEHLGRPRPRTGPGRTEPRGGGSGRPAPARRRAISRQQTDQRPLRGPAQSRAARVPLAARERAPARSRPAERAGSGASVRGARAPSPGSCCRRGGRRSRAPSSAAGGGVERADQRQRGALRTARSTPPRASSGPVSSGGAAPRRRR